MNIDVFISHHTDSSRSIVEAISNKLESVGIRCWHSSRDIAGGAYAGSIMQALSGCRVFLLVLNRPASESAHVLNELEIATNRLSRKEDVTIVPFHIADEDIAPEARYYIQRHHWIDAVSPPMYKRIEELTDHLLRLLGREPVIHEKNAPAYRLVSQLPRPRDIFRGRDDLLEQICRSFDAGKRVLFLEGIGGIGKSEIAKQYAIRRREDYDNVVFLTYSGSLQQMVCNPTALIIEGLEQSKEESDRDFFRHKLGVLTAIADKRTLLIVDNFDVNDDPDLQEFLRGSYRVIFTTRNAHPGHDTLRIGTIDDMDVLMSIFTENYGSEPTEEEKPVLMELFRHVECHTYTIELIAKQMEASFLTPGEMLELLKGGRLQADVAETVAGRDHQKTAFEHICALFNTGSLSDGEKRILMYLSLAGIEGVPALRFREWAQLKSFEEVNQLAAKSWIRKDAGRRLSMHPMVREVVHHTLAPTADNCRDYLEKIYWFCHDAWFRKYNENLEAADAVEALLVYFRELNGRDSMLFQAYCNFLWQMARFDASIFHMHRVYDACVRDLGLDHMLTGFCARALGGCYFNARREQESIRWYRQGLDSMLASGAGESEDLALSYEKVARCYTWEYEQDFEQARQLFERAQEIRYRLLERLDRGEKMVMLSGKTLDYSIAYSRIGGAYMEMGRMCQAMGDYEKGIEYAMKDARLLEEHNPDNISSLAYGYYDSGVCRYQLALQRRADGDEAAATELLARAEQDLGKALEINLRMRGGLAIDTIENQEYLADVYAAQRRYGDASNAYMAALLMVEKTLGPDHPHARVIKQKMDFPNA